MSKFEKSGTNHKAELKAHDYVLTDPHFQRPNLAIKRAILAQLGLEGAFGPQTFDLVRTPTPREPLEVDNVGHHLDGLQLVEVKATRKPIDDIRLNRFFFGSTETQYALAAACPERYRYAFVVLNDNNAYGRPFYVLLTPDEVAARTRARRVQYQVNFYSDLADGTVTGDGPHFEMDITYADDPSPASTQAREAR